MTKPQPTLAVLAVVAVLALPMAAQTNWLVAQAGGPGVDFIDIPAAVAAAQSGDQIFVLPGTYAAFSVTGKALTIIGSGSHPAGTHIGNPLLGGAAPFRGTTIGAAPTGSTFVMMDMSFGFVTFGATIHGTDMALRITAPGSRIVLSNIVATGASAGGGFGGMGMYLAAGTVHASHCTFKGSSGTPSTYQPVEKVV